MLPIHAEPQRDESASGYLLRAMTLNGATVKDALSLFKKTRQYVANLDDADLMSELAGIPAQWFDHRLPRSIKTDGRQEVALFGFTWRPDWLARGVHQQVCPICLRERGVARLEWDLIAYPVCHIHGFVLQDSCRMCGESIRPDRAALDICSCGKYLSTASHELQPAQPLALSWCAWLSQELLKKGDAVTRPADLQSPVPQLEGTSPDGAFRLIHAYAGGLKAFRAELTRTKSSFLSSRQAEDLIGRGLQLLMLSVEASVAGGLPSGTPHALGEQVALGITAKDRTAAAREMMRHRIRPRRRNAVSRSPTQQELFGDVA